MEEIETVVTEEVPTREEFIEELEEQESSEVNFVDILGPEDAEDEIDELKTPWKRYFYTSSTGAVFGGGSAVVSLAPIANLIEGAETIEPFAQLGATVGIGAVGAAAAYHYGGKQHELWSEIEDLQDMTENWYKVPGQVDLSYLVEDGIVVEKDEEYRSWRAEKADDWSDAAMIADLTNQELEELGVVREKSVSPWEYGTQRVFIEEDDEHSDLYKFVVEVHEDEELINSYWGITDEKGRRMVVENDAALNYDYKESEFQESNTS